MKRLFCTYKQALALKELGFDEPCLTYYHENQRLESEIVFIKGSKFWNLPDISEIAAPTYSQAFRWFRDVHELEGVPQKAASFSWFKFCIWKYTSNGKHRVNDAFDFEHKTYEEAESACLDKLIEIIKNK